VSDYLVKPFESLAEVQAAVARALKTRASRMEADQLVKELETRAKEYRLRELELTTSLNKAKDELDELATQLQRTEAVAHRQVEQIDSMIDNVDNGILVTDMRGGVLSMNRELRMQLQAAAFKGTGISVDRLPGDASLRKAIVTSRGVARLDSGDYILVQSSDAEGRPWLYEVRSARLVGSGGTPTGIITTVRKRRPAAARV
jgi:predicted RNase H-like nuclease (RuvC/YqgF family)